MNALEKISSMENLSLALNYTKDGAKRFFLPDFFRHQDYVHESKSLLRELSIRLKRKRDLLLNFFKTPKAALRIVR